MTRPILIMEPSRRLCRQWLGYNRSCPSYLDYQGHSQDRLVHRFHRGGSPLPPVPAFTPLPPFPPLALQLLVHVPPFCPFQEVFVPKRSAISSLKKNWAHYKIARLDRDKRGRPRRFLKITRIISHTNTAEAAVTNTAHDVYSMRRFMV
jgi:hypothetical protein